jgi:hypothetical protein
MDSGGDGADARAQGARDAVDIAAVATVPRMRGGATAAVRAVGRVADMAALDRLLAEWPTVVVTEAARAAGQGSLGKTWLARAYAAARPDLYPEGAEVVPLGRPDRAGLDLAALGLRLGLATSGSLPARVRTTLDGLGRTPGRILIADDVPDAATLASIRPGNTAVRVVATARRADWAGAAGLAQLPLERLAFEDAAALVVRDRGDLRADMPEPARIAATLDEVPEALDLAARTLAVTRKAALGDPVAYLRALRAVPVDDVRIADHGRLRVPAGRERAVLRAVAVAHDQLNPHHGPDITARTLLCLAAALIPGQPFPESLLRRAAAMEPESPEAMPAGEAGTPDTPQVAQGLARLRALGLLRDDGATPGLYLPPAVAAYVAGATPLAMAEARARMEAAAARAAADALLAGNVNELLSWQTHLHHLTEIALRLGRMRAGVLQGRVAEQLHALGMGELPENAVAGGGALLPPPNV